MFSIYKGMHKATRPEWALNSGDFHAGIYCNHLENVQGKQSLGYK